MTASVFIPIILSSLGLAYASFMRNKNWIIVAFVIWLTVFMLTFYIR